MTLNSNLHSVLPETFKNDMFLTIFIFAFFIFLHFSIFWGRRHEALAFKFLGSAALAFKLPTFYQVAHLTSLVLPFLSKVDIVLKVLTLSGQCRAAA